MASRAFAVLAAIGMIAGAFVYRYGVPGSDGSGGAGGGGASAGAVVCAAELGDEVCASLGGRVTMEPAVETAERLIGSRTRGQADVAAWLAPGPWAEMVEEGRPSSTALFDDSRVIATTPLVAVVKKGRNPPACAATLAWKCIADTATDPTSSFGADAPSKSSGLFIRAAVLVGFFGNTDFGSNDFQDAQPTLDAFGDRANEAAQRGASDLNRFLTVAPSVSMYLTMGATTTATPAVDVVAPAPTISIHATLSTVSGRKVDGDRVTKALTDAGWVAGRDRASGLPSPGVLLALREAVR